MIGEARQRLEAIRRSSERAWRSGDGGRDLARRLAYETDALIHGLWRRIAPRAFARVDLVAVGGYGRAELAPFSDWDLWLMPHRRLDAHAEREIEAFLRALWDLRAKVGHKIGTPAEIVRAFDDDHHAATAALEARLLAGDGTGFVALVAARDRWLRRRRNDFVRAKLEEREARRARHGASAFLMEPDVKDGRGGLREAQAVFWIARALLGGGAIEALVSHGLLYPREFDELREAEGFLWRVRAGLHWLHGRAVERLGFEAQQRLADAMGYTDGDRPAVERFMRDYFRRAGRIERICGLLAEDFAARIAPRRRASRPLGDGFVRRGDRLALEHPFVFRERPARLVLVFARAQAERLTLAPDALRRVREDVHLIDDDVRADADARRAFLSILRAPHRAAATLRAMHVAGVLGRFVPEFRHAVGLGQFNRYHAYTVDEHTLRAIAEAGRFFDPSAAQPARQVADAVAQVHRPDVLLLALLFHDLAKGMGGDHAELGASLAEARAGALGMHEDSAALVDWLVRQHLRMAKVAQRADIHDPEVVRAFAAELGDAGRLAYLYLLTIADIRAVAPGVWNDWKATLLDELYQATKAALLGGGGAGFAERLRLRRATALRLARAPRAAAERALGLLDDEAIVRTPPRRLARVIELLAEGVRADARGFVDPDYGECFAIAVADDRPGLFAELADAAARGRVAIAAAQAERLADGRVLDLFVLAGRDGQALDGADAEAVAQRMAKAIRGAWRPRPRRTRIDVLMRRIEPRVRRVREASSRRFAVEVVAADRQGLLADLARAISRQGWSVRGAQAVTYGERAVDVFLLDPPPGEDADAAWPALERALAAAAALPDEAGGSA